MTPIFVNIIVDRIMNKITNYCLLAIALLGLSFYSYAQMPQMPQVPRTIPAVVGEAHVVRQGSYTPDFKVDGKKGKVRNVILLIGDGMGPGPVNAAMYANGGKLTMTNLRTIGWVRTQSADNFTTDSAASGTAYATGQKTKNGYVGMGPDLEILANLPEKLAPKGYISGVVSTDDLNGATPASFFAHKTARGDAMAIWGDLAGSKLSFASAGTKRAYEMQSMNTQEAIDKEFTIINTPEDEKSISQSKKLLYLPISVAADRGDYLPRTTKMALDYLSKRATKGFFLMVEGARIDKEAHNQNLSGVVRETLDFDKAVEAAIRFAEADGHTLVIITADHDTGAVALAQGTPDEGFVSGVFGSRGHSACMVPLFAYGPMSQLFMGVQENSDVSNKIYSLLSK